MRLAEHALDVVEVGCRLPPFGVGHDPPSWRRGEERGPYRFEEDQEVRRRGGLVPLGVREDDLVVAIEQEGAQLLRVALEPLTVVPIRSDADPHSGSPFSISSIKASRSKVVCALSTPAKSVSRIFAVASRSKAFCLRVKRAGMAATICSWAARHAASTARHVCGTRGTDLVRASSRRITTAPLLPRAVEVPTAGSVRRTTTQRRDGVVLHERVHQPSEGGGLRVMELHHDASALAEGRLACGRDELVLRVLDIELEDVHLGEGLEGDVERHGFDFVRTVGAGG